MPSLIPPPSPELPGASPASFHSGHPRLQVEVIREMALCVSDKLKLFLVPCTRMISGLSPKTKVEPRLRAMAGYHTSKWFIYNWLLSQNDALIAFRCGIGIPSPRQHDVRKCMFLNCARWFSQPMGGALKDSLLTLLLGRKTGRCRRFRKRSSFPGPKCV